MRSLFRRQGRDHREATPLSRRFTYRYLIAVTAFVALFIAVKVGEEQALDRLQRNTAQLEAAATQPARVYRLLELSNRVHLAPQAADISQVVGELEQEADTLRLVQRALATGEGGNGLPSTPPAPELYDLYFGTDTRLDQDVRDIANAGQLVADFSADTDAAAAARGEQLRILETDVPGAAAELERAVRLYTNANDQIIEERRDQTTMLLLGETALVMVVVFGLFRPMARSIHMETSHLEDAERIHRENNERQTFRNDLTKALEVTDNEAEVLATVERALGTVVPENPVELLLSDASQIHLRRVAEHPSQGAAKCPVDSPKSCAALRSTQRIVYESSRMLNVCPKLPEHDSAPCSAVCVPVTFNGQALGVLHATGADNQPPNHTQIERLTVLASETGARLGHLQVMRMTELQATTDGLTGLFNRRSLEAKARSLMLDHVPFSIALADLDDFKELNDTYGHETGDRALRLFATSLRRHLRPDDIASRYGGEEFVIILPNTGITEAVRALNRLQVAITDDIGRSSSVPFTTSWGLTDSSAGITFDEIVAVADNALYSAKRAGKNCIVVDGEAARAASTALDDALSAVPPGTDDTDGTDGHRADPDLVELDLGMISDGVFRQTS
jgi:diguanylate cyclase (GGDEF)-like protein